VRGQLRHFPQRQQRGASRLSRPCERLPAHRSESTKVDWAIQRVSRSRSASSHGWLRDVR
jgi:hypothetical protein